MKPNDEKDAGLEKLAQKNPLFRELLDLLAQMKAEGDADPNPPPLTDAEKETLLKEWEKANPFLR